MNVEGFCTTFEYRNPEGTNCIGRPNPQNADGNIFGGNDPQWQWSGDGGRTWAAEDELRVRTFSGAPPDAHVKIHTTKEGAMDGEHIIFTFGIRIGPGPYEAYPLGIIDWENKKWQVVPLQIKQDTPIQFKLVPTA